MEMTRSPLSRRTLRLPVVALTAAALALSTVSPAVLAQPQDAAAEARARYDRGKKLYEEGAFDAALTEFQRAYQLKPSYRILYNIGQAQLQQNDYAGALKAFEQYLTEGSKELDAKRKADVEKEISSLKNRVANLTVKTNVPGAEISIDDVAVGKTPLSAPLIVNAGKRRVSAAKQGRVPVTKVVTLAGADSTTVDLDLAEPTGATPPPPPPATTSAPPPPPPASAAPPPSAPPPADNTVSTSNATPMVIAWVATGALAVGAAVTGVLALGASNDLKKERDATTSKSSLDDKASKAKTMALVSDILTGAAVVGGGIAIYLTVTSGDSKQTGARPLAPSDVKVGISPTGVTLLGSF